MSVRVKRADGTWQFLTGTGAIGLSGIAGPPGYPGEDGEDGWPGIPGPPGATGASGTGSSGVPIRVTTNTVVATDTGWVVPEALEIAAGVSLEIAGGARVEVTGPVASRVVQVATTQTGALITGTTILPIDNTLPQNSEGIEVLTRAITPTSATNKLLIAVVVNCSHSAASGFLSAALFQDNALDALAAQTAWQLTATGSVNLVFTYVMTAGTTSATTFKVRAGSSAVGTLSFNGIGGNPYFAGVMASSLTITELTP
jgi:hypothetical protein